VGSTVVHVLGKKSQWIAVVVGRFQWGGAQSKRVFTTSNVFGGVVAKKRLREGQNTSKGIAIGQLVLGGEPEVQEKSIATQMRGHVVKRGGAQSS